MIKSIKIHSFKSLENIDIELGHINFFIGANGSGKTNLLEALGVLSAASAGRIDDEALLRRGVRPGYPALYKSSFKGSRQSSEIRFEIESENALYNIGIYNPIEHPKPTWRYHTEKLLSNGIKLVGRSHHNIDKYNPEAGLAALTIVNLPDDDPAKILLDILRNYAIHSPNTLTLRGLISDQQQREPIGLSGGRMPEAIQELLDIKPIPKNLRDAFDSIFQMIEWAETFGWGRNFSQNLSKSVASKENILVFQDKYMSYQRNKLTGYDASEGALYVLFCMVLALHQKSPRFFAIDNVDHALNPRLAKYLMKNFCEWILNQDFVRQVLLTSHNPLVLDGLPLQDERVRLFVVDRSNKGKTIVTRIVVNDELIKYIKEGWTLSRLWVTGNFGGVPNV